MKKVLLASSLALSSLTITPLAVAAEIDLTLFGFVDTVGMASKARLDSELVVKPEGTSN